MIRILLLGILILLVFRTIGKLLFPPVHKDPRNFNYREEEKKEGEVTVESKNSNQKHVSNQEGEYVDYEEID